MDDAIVKCARCGVPFESESAVRIHRRICGIEAPINLAAAEAECRNRLQRREAVMVGVTVVDMAQRIARREISRDIERTVNAEAASNLRPGDYVRWENQMPDRVLWIEGHLVELSEHVVTLVVAHMSGGLESHSIASGKQTSMGLEGYASLRRSSPPAAERGIWPVKAMPVRCRTCGNDPCRCPPPDRDQTQPSTPLPSWQYTDEEIRKAAAHGRPTRCWARPMTPPDSDVGCVAAIHRAAIAASEAPPTPYAGTSLELDLKPTHEAAEGTNSFHGGSVWRRENGDWTLCPPDLGGLTPGQCAEIWSMNRYALEPSRCALGRPPEMTAMTPRQFEVGKARWTASYSRVRSACLRLELARSAELAADSAVSVVNEIDPGDL